MAALPEPRLPETGACPRCEHKLTDMKLAAWSLTARADDGPPIAVCRECGHREVVRTFHGLRHLGLSDWPLSAEQVEQEDYEIGVLYPEDRI